MALYIMLGIASVLLGAFVVMGVFLDRIERVGGAE